MKPTTILIASLLCGLTNLTVFAHDPHVEAVIRTVEGARGTIEMTEDGQSLKLVDLRWPEYVAHAHREHDPFDETFYEHLGHITTLESLRIIATKFNEAWMPHIAKLTNLKTLHFTDSGKHTDAGMEQLASLTNLEEFSFRGSVITGTAYAKFDGFDKLTRVSHRGSRINDEGLKTLCEQLPNLENISLAHAKFTDAGAPHLAKLTKLKGLELGAADATSAALRHITALPLEYLQLGEGFEKSESLPIISGIGTLKRLTLNNCRETTVDDLKLLASMKQLEKLELNYLPLTDERIAQLEGFGFLKELNLIDRKNGYPEELQARIQALLPKVTVKVTVKVQ